jgi:hypothetical protein
MYTFPAGFGMMIRISQEHYSSIKGWMYTTSCWFWMMNRISQEHYSSMKGWMYYILRAGFG